MYGIGEGRAGDRWADGGAITRPLALAFSAITREYPIFSAAMDVSLSAVLG